MAALIPIILSGGAGTRLWPLSREALPKPFIRLADNETLLLKTLKRAAALPQARELMVVTHREHYFLSLDECERLGQGAPPVEFLLEPAGRNTAPAIAAAALRVAQRHGEDAVMLVLPADHLIADAAAFAEAVGEAERLARQGRLVTFGIAPRSPETAFGYIEMGERLQPQAFAVTRFVEKPDAATAARYVASGRFAWNAGMFCLRAGAALAALRSHAGALTATVERAFRATDFARTPAVLAASFAEAQEQSFDYAVMEKTADTAVVLGRFDWSDVGSWNAVADLLAPDAQGNRVNGEALLLDATDCFVQSAGRMVAAVGVERLLIVDTPDALLVARRERAQDVKRVVERLRVAAHATAREHRTVHRPWGSFTVLEEGPRFKIKRIVVKPGASLSLQKHGQRSEHWVVISGEARVVNGERELTVQVDESTYIRAGTPHRLSNQGTADCVIIEVQAGDYVGEDDIVRLQDSYGRA